MSYDISSSLHVYDYERLITLTALTSTCCLPSLWECAQQEQSEPSPVVGHYPRKNWQRAQHGWKFSWSFIVVCQLIMISHSSFRLVTFLLFSACLSISEKLHNYWEDYKKNLAPSLQPVLHYSETCWRQIIPQCLAGTPTLATASSPSACKIAAACSQSYFNKYSYPVVYHIITINSGPVLWFQHSVPICHILASAWVLQNMKIK